MGPTGCGKSALAEAIADAWGGELINADAFQVYRGLDIGTNKPEVRDRYHLLDLKSPQDSYGVGEFVLDAQKVILSRLNTERPLIVVGGTGFYVRALFEEYGELAPPPDPALREELQQLTHDELLRRLDALAPNCKVDRPNPVRVRRALEKALSPPVRLEVRLPACHKVKIGLDVDPDALNASLDIRTEELFAKGWMDEVKSLAKQGFGPDDPAFRAIGYSEIWRWLRDSLSFESLLGEVQLRTRQYAKRQRSWLRSEPNLIRWKRAFPAPLGHAEVESILNRIKQASI